MEKNKSKTINNESNTAKKTKNNIPRGKLIRKIIFATISAGIIVGVSIALSIGNKIAFEDFYNNITAFLCPAEVTEEDDSSSGSARASGKELARQILREGSVLVKNEDDNLPFTGATKVNVFGHNSVDWYYCGSGSGSVGSDSTRVDICQAIQQYGLQYNTDLYNYYYNYRSPLGGNNPSTLSNKCEDVCILAEPDLTNELKNGAISFSNYAIICLGRKAGETEDLPHAQYKYERPTDTSKGYLEVSTEEIALLTWVGANFSKVCVIVNSTNPLQLDFLDTIPGLKSCLVVGATGNYGPMGICDLLFGEESPSGHLTDTYPRDFKNNITYYSGGYEMTGQYQNASSSAWPYNRNYKRGQERTVFYNDYKEGIYVGYKWFETADAEGYWNNYSAQTLDGTLYGYKAVVQYPFGHGLSYTSFDWEVEEVSLANNGAITSNSQVIDFKVKVTNSGTKPGKDVVQIYLTAPYDKTNHGIEKAHVALVGYGKTQLLNPSESTYVKISVEVVDFESYDCYDANNNGHKGYELDAGNYVLTFRTDAHYLKEMANNTYTYKVASTINIDTDEVTGETVKNRFTGNETVDGFSIDGSNCNQNIEYISRANFPALPTAKAANRNWNTSFEVSPSSQCNNTYSTSMASAWDNATGLDAFGKPIPTNKPTWGASGSNKVINNGTLTELGMQLANPTNWNNDDLWNRILNQITWDEAINVINTNSLSRTAGIATAGKPDCSDADGPQQIGGVAGISGATGTAYPSPTVTAQCWNPSIAYSFGKSYGMDMQTVGKDGAYAFGCNIHRSPYTGRNFEYFSEDAFLSGKCAANAAQGVAVCGKYCFMKHFAVNDQEFHRVGLYTWLTEQALREIYLKPFEKAVKNGNLSALMTSFNRVGATWAGGNEALLTGVLRNEWGFHGQIITDYCESRPLMDQAQAIRAGSNYGMTMTYTYGSANSTPTQSGSSARLQWRLKNVCKEVIYGYIHPLLINDEYNRNPMDDEEIIVVTPSKKPWVWWVPMLLSFDFAVITGLVFLGYKAFRPLPDIFPDPDGISKKKNRHVKEVK